MRKILTFVAAGTLLALPIASPAKAASIRPACSDGVDNDLDGLVDYRRTAGGDPECTTNLDGDEGGVRVLSVEAAPDAHLDFHGPLPVTFRHLVTVRSSGSLPEQVTLTQTHTPTLAGGGFVMTDVVAVSTSQGSCQRTLSLADFVCDLGRVLPGASVTIEASVMPHYLGPTLTYDLWLTSSVSGSPLGSDRVDTAEATTAYNVTQSFV